MKRGRLICLLAMMLPVAVVLPAAAAAAHTATVGCTRDYSQVQAVPAQHDERPAGVAEPRVGRHRRATEREGHAGRRDEEHHHAVVDRVAASGPLFPKIPSPSR
jgi:hypothetical protein